MLRKNITKVGNIRSVSAAAFFPILVVSLWTTGFAQEVEYIDSDACLDCHEYGIHDTRIKEDLSHSSHEFLACLDCHQDKDMVPHAESDFEVGCDGCRSCHDQASEEYQGHGRSLLNTCEDIPQCADCHGDHDVLPSGVKHSKTHPTNLPKTCGVCHEDLNLTKKYDILIDHPIAIYENSVHGKATKGGVYVAATCNDCHSTGGTAHKILAPGEPNSTINHFNIPRTCGQCHKGIEYDFMEGIHGQLVARGETDAPVCTDCHGEHGIISPGDPHSPVSRSKVAEMTCSPCHESTVLNEKYGIPSGRLRTYIDSYHGLKSKAGDTHVANCASCHGVHRILPSSDSTSTIYPDNLEHTCGECHPGISAELAQRPIHGGTTGEGLQTSVADIIEKIYIIAIIVIIGAMVIHWLIDLIRQIRLVMQHKPQVRRMRINEVWQHTLLMISFLVLVLSGFALRFDQAWISTFFFGWEGGFEFRGLIHRIAAVVFILTVLWHVLFLIFSPRGRQFLKDMVPIMRDYRDFFDRIRFNLGFISDSPKFERFSYVEKAEYWALVWGTVIMILTGFLLWFDNWVIGFFPKGTLDVALVIHYYEAWLAFLAILIWHLYSTVFNPHVYPMNPSWLTGKMPEEMYKHEHPEHLEQAKKEEQELIKSELEKLARPEEKTGEGDKA